MQLPELTRSTTLRWALLVAGTFADFIVALLGFLFLQTKEDMTMRSDLNSASQARGHAVTSHEADVYLTPKQLVERAAEREASAKLFPPGKVREWVVQEVQRERDRAVAEMNQSLYEA